MKKEEMIIPGTEVDPLAGLMSEAKSHALPLRYLLGYWEQVKTTYRLMRASDIPTPVKVKGAALGIILVAYLITTNVVPNPTQALLFMDDLILAFAWMKIFERLVVSWKVRKEKETKLLSAQAHAG